MSNRKQTTATPRTRKIAGGITTSNLIDDVSRDPKNQAWDTQVKLLTSALHRLQRRIYKDIALAKFEEAQIKINRSASLYHRLAKLLEAHSTELETIRLLPPRPARHQTSRIKRTGKASPYKKMFSAT